MTARIADVSIHAEDPAALARFWSAVVGSPEPPAGCPMRDPEGTEFCLQ